MSNFIENNSSAKSDSKLSLFSGIQPSGNITIGNYLGAVKNFLEYQRKYDSYFSVVDMHSLTTVVDPKLLRQNTYQLFALYIAMGLDPEQCTLFVQSHVKEHAELTWVLNCLCYVGEAKRMIQFKEKSKSHPENVNLGLLVYPVLQTADILLYQSAVVPVGKDQKQHIEIARDLALRFNSRYGQTFTIPEIILPKRGAKIMSLSNPKAKMSKSDDDQFASVYVLDEPDLIVKKFKRAVTDSLARVNYSAEQHGVSNLLDIYCLFSGDTAKKAVERFDGQGYGAFKATVAETVVEGLRPIRERFKELIDDQSYLNQLMRRGAEKARAVASATLKTVYERIGFVE